MKAFAIEKVKPVQRQIKLAIKNRQQKMSLYKIIG
jgi:hypothetical protein